MTTITSNGPRRRPKRACQTAVLIGALSVIILGQFVLFPFFLSVNFPSDDEYITNHMGDFRQAHSRSRRQKQPRKLPNRPPDGSLNGIPLYLQKTNPIISHAHCVGNNYESDKWKQRSCHFTNLCFNTTAKDFVLIMSPTEYQFAQDYLAHRPFLHTSSTLFVSKGGDVSTTVKGQAAAAEKTGLTVPAVGMGGINLKWGDDGIQRLSWFPKLAMFPQPVRYYAMPDWIVWMPFHSMNGANPGHLVWDDFLPMYTLLEMFRLLPSSAAQPVDYTWFPMRYVLDATNPQNKDAPLRGLWASCDVREVKTEECRKMMTKFMPLFVGKDYPYQFSSTQDFQLNLTTPAAAEEPVELICAAHGVAGIASLTDHGISKMHGWVAGDYSLTHNHGRGGQLYDFRNFLLQNMGMPTTATLPADGGHHKIVISQKSSDIFNRNMDFARQIQVLQEHFPNAQVEAYILKTLSLEEQLNAVRDASIFISLCGGGAVTAMFLPAGSSALLYYSQDGGAQHNRMTFKPALLDWDLFNAMSHLRVHWLPRNTMKTELDEQALVALIQHELALIDDNVFQ